MRILKTDRYKAKNLIEVKKVQEKKSEIISATENEITNKGECFWFGNQNRRDLYRRDGVFSQPAGRNF